MVSHLIYEGVNELNLEATVDGLGIQKPIVELFDNVTAYEDGLNVIFHSIQVVRGGSDILWYFCNVRYLLWLSLLGQLVFLPHQEGISHSSFSKWLLCYYDLCSSHLTLLEEWFPPIDGHSFILNNEPRVAICIVSFGSEFIRL